MFADDYAVVQDGYNCQDNHLLSSNHLKLNPWVGSKPVVVG